VRALRPRSGETAPGGEHLQLEDARVFDLPGKLPVIAVAASGPVSARIAAELGDGLFATEPDGDLVSSWRNLGGSGPAYAEMPLAWAADEDKAAQAVLDKSRFALTGWKVMAELPNPVNFEAATASITADQVKSQFTCGPDAGAAVGLPLVAFALYGGLASPRPRTQLACARP
jgi:G6PDH family F420-dependent oxidoreductase